MKKIIFLFLFFLISASVFGQNRNLQHYWLPEKYINAVVSGELHANDQLYPISAIITPFDQCSVIAYKSEIRPIRTKKISVQGQIKYEISNLYYVFNLIYISDTTIEKYKNGKTYLFIDRNKLIFEIVYKDYVERICFIDGIDGYRFNSFYGTKDYLMDKYKKK